jgi:hypothetical protein
MKNYMGRSAKSYRSDMPMVIKKPKHRVVLKPKREQLYHVVVTDSTDYFYEVTASCMNDARTLVQGLHDEAKYEDKAYKTHRYYPGKVTEVVPIPTEEVIRDERDIIDGVIIF